MSGKKEIGSFAALFWLGQNPNHIITVMQKDIHPENYRLCVFKDVGTNDYFITRSCAETRETMEVDGVEYPLIKMEISAASHPFYTGKVKLVDTAGRVDKFRNRYANRKK